MLAQHAAVLCEGPTKFVSLQHNSFCLTGKPLVFLIVDGGHLDMNTFHPTSTSKKQKTNKRKQNPANESSTRTDNRI